MAQEFPEGQAGIPATSHRGRDTPAMWEVVDDDTDHDANVVADEWAGPVRQHQGRKRGRPKGSGKASVTVAAVLKSRTEAKAKAAKVSEDVPGPEDQAQALALVPMSPADQSMLVHDHFVRL